jgi:Rhodopirellula transposase DDE domain
LKELADGSELVAGQIRRSGGGRKPLVESDAGLMEALLALIEPSTRGDPESPLRWTYKSVRRLATELSAQGHPISRTVVCELLHELNFSLQANCKTREGDSHQDRDAQFCYINDLVKTALIEQQPVISVDTKKKELVGDFKNGGRQWRPKGQPEAVRVHDFLIKELGRAVPYGHL